MPTSVVMPQMGESIAEGTIVRWIKRVGDAVERDEPLFEISTDKVDAEIPSPASGVLLGISVREGETVAVHSVVATIGEAGEVALPPAGPPSHDAAPAGVEGGRATDAAAGTSTSAGPRRTSPLVRRIAKDHHVDLSRVTGSGLGGRVTKHDILGYLDQAQATAPATASFDRVEPLSVMRKKIAEHMVLSQRTSAHVYSVFQVSFANIDTVRRQGRDADGPGAKVTYMAFIAKAVVEALGRHPLLNASLDGDRIVYREHVHLGVAVAIDGGLIVPVIKDAGAYDLGGLGRAIADVADRARSKRLSPEEVHGGTFTITNPGQLGAQFGTPIINQPQVAILGVGTIEKRPIVIDDAIAIRLMAYLTLGFDHRLIDGVVADRFMADVKHRLEQFGASQA